MRALYDWVLGWAEKPGGTWALAGISFAESSFFPLPPDILLIPMCLAVPGRALWLAAVCTAASVVGGVLGYTIGYLAFEGIGSAILDFYRLSEPFDRLGTLYAAYQGWAVTFAGFTPFPYKVFTIAAGFFKINLPVFIVASIIGRGGRFFLVAALLRWFGDPVKELIDRYFNLLTIAVAVLIAAGFLMLNYLSR